MTTLLVLAGAAGAGLFAWWRWAGRPAGSPNSPSVRITVPQGATASAVGEELARRGVIRSARAWNIRADRANATVQPGVYDVSPGESPVRLLRRLREGDIARLKVTFPEGYTLAKIADRLEDRGAADETRFLQLVTQDGDALRASFRPPAKLEGYLFPDTYTFPVGAGERDIAQQMLGNFDRLVARGKASEIKRTRRSLHQVVTIASLVEREARVDQDRARIAGVIANRLQRNMPLQIDATVQYARTLNGQGHAARLFYKDLDVESPYNTYKRMGLPPGPICNPGMASIEAALAPERHPYLYYVARADGSHVFGRTLADHQHNIRVVRQQQSRG